MASPLQSTPPLPTRAFQWDLARQVERLDWLLAQLPRYADWGYQELYLHLEDAVEFPNLPGVARADAYTHRQLGRLVDTAARHGIGVVPIVNLLGHTQYLIKCPELRDLNELRDTSGAPLPVGQICPLHPRTPEIAEKLLRDTAPFCTTGKVHVGLDESFSLGRHPRSRAEIADIGLAAHFARYVGRLHELACAHGLRMGMWADMLAFIPEAIPLLPRDLIAYDWYYYPFHRHPRVELYNFAEVDLATPLRAHGIEYWGCPMNGAFRYEPLPVFGDRLANLQSWWQRCRRTGASGFLVTSWEAYRLAIETTTVVDAAAASLWLDPEIEDHSTMLARGFERVYGRAHCHERARLALASDARAFAGYACWQANLRWDVCAPRESATRHAADARFFARLATRDLPPAFATSLAFRHYLAERDAFIRRNLHAVFRLRRLHAKTSHPAALAESKPWQRELVRLHKDTAAFAHALHDGRRAARAMWRLSREPKRQGQNEQILDADAQRLRQWKRWLTRITRRPATIWDATPVNGVWQLQFTVHNFAPAMQRVLVEQQQPDGTWLELHGRHTMEFRAYAARPQATIRREFATPVAGPLGATPDITVLPPLRIAVRGLGQVAISHVELTNGAVTLTADGWPLRRKKVLGTPAPQSGFPHLDWSTNQSAVQLGSWKSREEE
jgi:hypothetical protein